MANEELNNNFSDNESEESLVTQYHDLIQDYNSVVEQLQAYKIAEAYSITVENAAELLNKGTFDEVCEALDNAEAKLDDEENYEEDDDDEDNDDSNVNNLIEQNELLMNENKYLKERVKKLEISEPQKLKKSLEDKIAELEKKLELRESHQGFEESTQNYTDWEESYKAKYESLKKTADKIIDLKISEFDQKISSDKKYQQLIMSLILHSSEASKLLIKHLNINDSTREVIIDARSQISDLQQQMQELEQGSRLLNNSINKNKQSSVYHYNSNKEYFSFSKYYQEDLPNKINEIYNEQAQNININQIKNSNFIIVNDDKIIQALDLDLYGIPYCRVAAEPFWHNVGDWFGYYNAEGKFIPSKTQISDYYKFVRDTLELPLGVIVIDNFNQIPPEVYIEPLIKSIETTNNYKLVNPSMLKEDEDFVQIDKLHNLKFILIKSNNDTCFDIPKSMQKYELGV